MKEKIEWLAQLKATGQLTADDLEEIKSHLEESTMELSKSGLSEKESFLVAAERMGHPFKIGREFENAGSFQEQAKTLLYVTFGGIMVPLLFVLERFVSGLLILCVAHLDWCHFKSLYVWEATLQILVFSLFFGMLLWIMISPRSHLRQWLFKIGEQRWLFALLLLLGIFGLNFLTSGSLGLRQLALRELTPSTHPSHLQGTLSASVSIIQIALWLTLVIVVPRLIRNGKINYQTL